MPLRKNRITRKKHAPNVDLIPVMTGKKKWWESTTIRRAIVGLVNTLAAAFSLNASGAEVEALVAAVLGVITTVGVILGRKNAKKAIEPKVL